MEALWEAIKDVDVNVPDAVFAWLLMVVVGVKPLEDNTMIDSQHPCWLAFSTIPTRQPAGWLQRLYPQ